MNDTPEDLIRYDVLTQEALRGVIRKVLEEVATAGLPGDHHFFITFDTTFPGVRLSKRMRERYPESMTIVIQHTYWNLNTGDTAFEVDLTFNDIRERLRIPYAAVQAFFDPSVKFGLQFDVEAATAGNTEMVDINADGDTKLSGATDEEAGEEAAGENPETTEGETPNTGDADVVSLDSFRKKK